MERQYVEGRVSVITPVYNVERYIDKTLESVFAQTYKDIEIVLVDDCSKDNSAQIIAKYKESHPEIVYFLQPKNMGAGAARNKALELATGQYVAFLDSDDLWLPEKTEKQIKLMREKKSPFSYAAIDMMDEEGNTIKGKRELRETCDYSYLLHNTIIATSSVIVDRSVLGDFRMPLRRGGQDYATWLSLLRGGAVACGINETLVRYRVGSNSLSSNKFKSIKQVWEIQTQDEKINKVNAAFHVFCFCVNAAKKYFL
ncbi:MAG: glycosyltransferase family 2 protein [Segatella copri]